nr:hypothetical protein CFP56_00355 [Quercus suber]
MEFFASASFAVYHDRDFFRKDMPSPLENWAGKESTHHALWISCPAVGVIGRRHCCVVEYCRSKQRKQDSVTNLRNEDVMCPEGAFLLLNERSK